jgi:hypothetical protein
MQGQLRKVQQLCASNSADDKAEAARVLMEVQALLKSHHSNS